MEEEMMIQVASSNIYGYEYDEANKKLVVTFKNNSTYSYTDVPPDIAKEFAESKSPGKYFMANIRPKYTAEKIALRFK